MIALYILAQSVALSVYLFAASRNDPSLRIAALVAGTNLVSALAAIASTMLIGKDITRPRDPADMPPNSVATDTSTVKVGNAPAASAAA